MALATSNSDGLPDVRFVLLKEIDERGVIFYSDSGSSKGKQLNHTPPPRLLFTGDRWIAKCVFVDR